MWTRLFLLLLAAFSVTFSMIGRCYVAWEDDRNGRSSIFLGRRSCPAP